VLHTDQRRHERGVIVPDGGVATYRWRVDSPGRDSPPHTGAEPLPPPLPPPPPPLPLSSSPSSSDSDDGACTRALKRFNISDPVLSSSTGPGSDLSTAIRSHPRETCEREGSNGVRVGLETRAERRTRE
jgi:hypothetical protein